MKIAFSIIILVVLTAYMMIPVLPQGVPESASAQNWVEVKRITPGTNTRFTITQIAWRIIYHFSVNSTSFIGAFTATVFREDRPGWSYQPIFEITYMGGGGGTAYLLVDVKELPIAYYIGTGGEYVESYELIIQQDADSIPEFSPMIGLILIMALTIVVVAYKKHDARPLRERSGDIGI